MHSTVLSRDKLERSLHGPKKTLFVVRNCVVPLLEDRIIEQSGNRIPIKQVIFSLSLSFPDRVISRIFRQRKKGMAIYIYSSCAQTHWRILSLEKEKDRISCRALNIKSFSSFFSPLLPSLFGDRDSMEEEARINRRIWFFCFVI